MPDQSLTLRLWLLCPAATNHNVWQHVAKMSGPEQTVTRRDAMRVTISHLRSNILTRTMAGPKVSGILASQAFMVLRAKNENSLLTPVSNGVQ